MSRIFNSKFDSKCWNWQDSIQQYIHSIRKRGYRSHLLNHSSRTCDELLECGETNNDIEFVNKFRARLCFNQANMCGQVFCWMLNMMKYDMIKMFYTSLREVCRAWWRLLQNCCKLKWTIIPWYIMRPSNPDLNRSYFCEFSSYFYSSKVWIKWMKN